MNKINKRWAFLEDAEADPDNLEKAVKILTGLAKSKSFANDRQAQMDVLPVIKWQIIVEASRLVLDPRWGQIKDLLKRKD